MRTIKIDTEEKTVSEIEIAASIRKTIYRLHCNRIFLLYE